VVAPLPTETARKILFVLNELHEQALIFTKMSNKLLPWLERNTHFQEWLERITKKF
jgi:hypothetical protein